MSEAKNLIASFYAKYKHSDYEGAIADLDKAIGLNPNYAKAYSSRGLAKYFLEDYEGAVAGWEKAISLNPANKEKLQPYIYDARKKLEGK